MNLDRFPWRKSLSQVVTLAVLLILCLGIYLLSASEKPSGLFVRFLDVGQGDAELIQTAAGQNILIDGGPDSSVIARMDKYIPFYARNLDAVVLTHPHADHVAGLVSVLSKYQVKHVYISGVTYSTPDYLEFLRLIKDKSIKADAVKKGDSLELGSGIRLDFLFPQVDLTGKTSENVNNTTVVSRLVYGTQSALFMGDLESEGQQQLLQGGEIPASTIYKAPHHGSRDSAFATFYKLVDPKYVVIEVGKDNKFGHPNAAALQLYQAATILRTDQEGTISFEIGKDSVKRVE